MSLEGDFMIITDIIEVNAGRSQKKKAYKIFIDDDFAFLLYESELKQYQLAKGLEITPEFYEIIKEDTVFPRAKQKALNIISYSDKTEKEIYERLKEEYYTDDIVEQIIEYLKNYNYINDERYASNYIRSRKNRESKLAIKSKLLNKGINKKVLEKIIEEEYDLEAANIDENEDPEIIAIKKIISKKCVNLTNLSCKDKQKLINMLARKGFDPDKINKCI